MFCLVLITVLELVRRGKAAGRRDEGEGGAGGGEGEARHPP